jgi:hypothetical protein
MILIPGQHIRRSSSPKSQQLQDANEVVDLHRSSCGHDRLLGREKEQLNKHPKSKSGWAILFWTHWVELYMGFRSAALRRTHWSDIVRPRSRGRLRVSPWRNRAHEIELIVTHLRMNVATVANASEDPLVIPVSRSTFRVYPLCRALCARRNTLTSTRSWPEVKKRRNRGIARGRFGQEKLDCGLAGWFLVIQFSGGPPLPMH